MTLPRYTLFALLLLQSCLAQSQPNFDPALHALVQDFIAEFPKQEISMVDFNYRDYLRAIPPSATLERQSAFLEQYKKRLGAIRRKFLSAEERLCYDHLAFQLKLHERRLALEKRFRATNPEVPAEGLSRLDNAGDWYAFLAYYATGVDLSPEEIHQFGRNEVARVQAEIRAIRERLGYGADSLGFLRMLKDDRFYLTDRDSIVATYERKKATVLAHLPVLFEQNPADVPALGFMTWPDAGPFTPPGMYLSNEENPYGQAVFQYNFYGGRHNRRAMDWLLLHEGIPGHHFHRYVRGLAAADRADSDLGGLFFPGGTVEGWAAYVEYFGEDMGLYQDDFSRLGKWEWDLVRSARVVISSGIHTLGWTREQALAYWKANIPGQDDIAEREVKRCTDWPAQVLTYKIGAEQIMIMRRAAKMAQGAAFDLKRFHTRFLKAGYVPLEVMEIYLGQV